MTSNDRMMGFAGMVWFIGVVEDRNDPLMIGRVRVRMFGIHNPDVSQLRTDQLPWASVMQPITSAASCGVGTAPVGLVEGSWVFGFFKDGQFAQDPVVIGSTAGVVSKDTNKASYGYRDRRPEEDPDYEGQLVRKEAPRRLESRTLNDDGTGATFTEEGGSADERCPQADGLAPAYPLEDNIDQPDTSAVALGNTGNNPRLETSIIQHKLDTVDTEVPFAKPNTDLPEQYPPVTEEDPSRIIIRPRSVADCLESQIASQDSPAEVITLADTENQDFIQKAIDHTQLATSKFEEDSEPKETWDEPATQYQTKYPYSKVIETESGHVIEMDDTPGAERIAFTHRTGSFVEIHPDGSSVKKILGDDYEITLRDKFVHVESSLNVTVDKAATLYINRDGDESEPEEGENRDFNIVIGANSNINLEVRKGNLNTRVLEGNTNIRTDKGDVRVDVLEGNQIIHVAGGNTELALEGGDSILSIRNGKQVVSIENGDSEIYVGGDLKAEVSGDSSIISNNTKIHSRGDACITTEGSTNITATGNITATASGTVDVTSGSTMNLTAGGTMTLRAPRIDLNP